MATLLHFGSPEGTTYDTQPKPRTLLHFAQPEPDDTDPS